MFYVKGKINGKTVKTEITDENVFTTCPDCGCEEMFNLAEVFADAKEIADDSIDIFGTEIVCSNCTDKRNKLPNAKITADGINLLLAVVYRAGYDSEGALYRLFDEYGIKAVEELSEEDYLDFCVAVSDIITADGDNIEF